MSVTDAWGSEASDDPEKGGLWAFSGLPDIEDVSTDPSAVAQRTPRGLHFDQAQARRPSGPVGRTVMTWQPAQSSAFFREAFRS